MCVAVSDADHPFGMNRGWLHPGEADSMIPEGSMKPALCTPKYLSPRARSAADCQRAEQCYHKLPEPDLNQIESEDEYIVCRRRYDVGQERKGSRSETEQVIILSTRK